MGASASQTPTARTWARTWGRMRAGVYAAGRLVCPFHGFEFDTTGQCVATPYSDPPRTAKLRVFETHEVLGLVFAWWGIEGRPPQWSLPTDLHDQTGWCDLNIQTLRFPGHPQETTENSVDIGHLRYVHGYDSVDRTAKVATDGPYLNSRWSFRSVREIAKLATLSFDISANAHIYGLGYSFVEIHERSIGMDLRLWVLATPVDGTLIDLSLVSQVREIRKPKRLIVGLGFLPTRLRAPIMNKFMSAQQRGDVMQDEVIWRHKRYRPRPRLCRSDGEIMPFRYYCAQFYPDPVTSTSSAQATSTGSAQATSTGSAQAQLSETPSRGHCTRCVMSKTLDWLSRLVTVRPYLTIIVLLVLTVLLAAGATFRAPPTEGADVAFLPPGHPVADATREISERFSESGEVNSRHAHLPR